jgi:hypothetical protein
MRHVVLLVPTLFTIMFMFDVHVAMAGAHSMRRATGQKSRLATGAADDVGDGIDLQRLGPVATMPWGSLLGPGDVLSAVPGDADAPLRTASAASWRHSKELEHFRVSSILLQTRGGADRRSPTEDRWLVRMSLASRRMRAPQCGDAIGEDSGRYDIFPGISGGRRDLVSNSGECVAMDCRATETSLQK